MLKLSVVAPLLSTVAMGVAFPVHAQVASTPAAPIERDARTGAPVPVPRAPEQSPIGGHPAGAGAAATAPCGSGNCVEVRGFRFEGNTVFPEADLARIATARYPAAKAFDLAGLRAVADAITNFYRRKGYLVATAWLPPQQAGDGTILIRVVEGKLSSPDPVVVAPGATSRQAPAAAAAIRQKLCKDGTCQDRLLRRDRLEAALLAVGDALGRNVTVQLAPGVQEGSSILSVDATSRKDPILTVGADNFGSDAVGRYQFATTLSLANSLTAGDRLSIQAMTTQKADVASGGLQYSLPLAFTGLRATFGAFYSNYTLTGIFAPLAAHGRSYGATGALAWTALRRADSYVTFSTALEVARLSDVMLGLSNGRDHWSWRTGIQAQTADHLLGMPAQTQVQLNFVRTVLDFDDPRFDSGHTSGAASKVVGRLNRVQLLTQGVTLGVAANGQWAWRNLDAYDKLTISGPAGVRAYPTGEYGGDRAIAAQFSLGWGTSLGALGTLSLEGFYDAGWARLKVDPLDPKGNDVHLDGAGAQVSLARQRGYALSLFWARAVSTRASQIDGHKSRIGASLSYAF